MIRKLEIACFDVASIISAARAGADRIELCADYDSGSLTPPPDRKTLDHYFHLFSKYVLPYCRYTEGMKITLTMAGRGTITLSRKIRDMLGIKPDHQLSQLEGQSPQQCPSRRATSFPYIAELLLPAASGQICF